MSLLSFFIFGIIPVIPYIIGLFKILGAIIGKESDRYMFISAVILTGVALFILGLVKSKYSIRSWLYCGLESLFLGFVVAIISYYFAVLIEPLSVWNL